MPFSTKEAGLAGRLEAPVRECLKKFKCRPYDEKDQSELELKFVSLRHSHTRFFPRFLAQ